MCRMARDNGSTQKCCSASLLPSTQKLRRLLSWGAHRCFGDSIWQTQSVLYHVCSPFACATSSPALLYTPKGIKLFLDPWHARDVSYISVHAYISYTLHPSAIPFHGRSSSLSSSFRFSPAGPASPPPPPLAAWVPRSSRRSAVCSAARTFYSCACLMALGGPRRHPTLRRWHARSACGRVQGLATLDFGVWPSIN
jgi:hypothetical protein